MYRSLLILLLGISAAANAADWIVSTSGDDADGKGTVAKPFRTVARALDAAGDSAKSVAKSGNTVMLRGSDGGNTYRECNLRITVPLTLRSYPGERAHIHCDAKAADSSVLQIETDASGSTIADLELSGSAYYGVKLNTDWYGNGDKKAGVSNVLLENLRIHDTGRDGIKITPKASHVTIRGSEIWNTGATYPPGTPQDEKNADGIDNVNGSNMLVEDNYIHDIATTGLYFKGGAHDAIVQRNRIERAAVGIRVGFDTSPEFFDIEDNPHYYEAIGGIVRNNYIRDTIYAGIALYAAKDATVVNNTIVDAAKKGQAALFFGITLQDRDPEAGRPPNVNPRIERNLVVQKGGNCVEIRWLITEINKKLVVLSALDGKPGLDDNAYHDSNGRCRFVDDRNGRGLLPAMSLEEWRKNEHADANSVEAPFSIDDSTGRLVDASGTPAARGVVEIPNRVSR